MFKFFKKFKRKKYHEILKLINKGDLYFDIGAHLGEKSKPFIEKKIKTIMVEPLPGCVKNLKKLYSKNSIVKIIPKGLGSKNTKKILSINKQMPTTSTFAKHWKSGRFSNLKWHDKIQVQITTLDSLIKKFGNPQYIKIDVEGYEMNVLKSSIKTLRNMRPVIFMEYAPYLFYENGFSPKEFFNFLKKYNYRIYDLNFNRLNKIKINNRTSRDIILICSK